MIMHNFYNKAPLTIHDQIQLLKSRGLIISNELNAISQLQEVGYYRLSAYFIPFQVNKDQFVANIDMNQIVAAYSFDRDLRLLVFDCIERIEVALRNQMVYHMSLQNNDSHWHDKQIHFINPYYNKIGNLIDPFSDFQAIIAKAKKARTPEPFIKHYLENYSNPSNPPSWMCFELLTIGELSHLFRGLHDNSDKKRIAAFFDLHPTVFTSWLHTLTYVRNLCAHHSRLWNRDLAIEPELLQKPVGKWIEKSFENNKRVFYFLCVLRYLLIRANSNNQLTNQVENLLNKYPDLPIKYMGIPSDGRGNLLEWRDQLIWK